MKPGELEQLLADLTRAKEPAARFQLGRKLNRAARGNWTEQARVWFSEPKTTTQLLRALHDADNKSAVEIIGTLGAASQRYEYKDERVLSALYERFESANDALKLAIVQAIPQYATSRVWQLVTAGLACKPAKDAHFTVGLATGRYGSQITAAERGPLQHGLLEGCAREKNKDALSAMLSGIKAIGTRSAVAPLRSLKEHHDDPIVLEEIELAIAGCAVREQGPAA